VKQAAAQGKTVLGICNGFQILCEAGLLPGVLVRNTCLHFRCETILVRVEHPSSRFTSEYLTGQVLRLPIAHGEGHYVADEATLDSLFQNRRVLFTYCDTQGRTTTEANPNGSQRHIAGITNRAGNVLGLMPHPERASEKILGSSDGLGLFASILASATTSNTT
jgi:phosphoribosylformylglycinamidine synthase